MLSTFLEIQTKLRRACLLIIVGLLLCFFDLGGSFVHEYASPVNKWEPSEIMGVYFSASYDAHKEYHGGIGIRIDLFDDSVGILLILMGVTALRRLRHDDLYRWCMGLCYAFAAMFGLFSLVDHIVFDQPPWVTAVRGMATTLLPLVMALFSAGMISISRDFDAHSTLRWWRSTAWLFLIILIVGSGIEASSLQLVQKTQERTTLQIDWLFGRNVAIGMAIGIAYAVAWIFLLVSLNKMRHPSPTERAVKIDSPMASP